MEELFERLMHDLRNPLGVVSCYADIIPTAPPAEREELCERLQVNVQRALHVLAEFALLADLRRGRSTLQSETWDMVGLVQDLVTEVESVERRPGQIRHRIGTHILLNASRPQVTSALRMLLRAALHATAPDDGLDVVVCEARGQVVIKLTAPVPRDPEIGQLDRLPTIGIEVELAERVAALHGGRLTIEQLPSAEVITLVLPAGL
jgi:signal transduction histidine kinase